jgi:hypothetical protein
MRQRMHTLVASSLGLATAVGSLAACGSQAVATDEPGAPARGAAAEPSGEREAVAPAEPVVHVVLELDDLMNVRDPGADQTRVSLITVDAAGVEQRAVLGVFAGICTDADVAGSEAGLPGSALAGADCRGGARESRIRVLREGDELVALRAWIEESAEEGDFPDYDEVQRVVVASGAKIVIGDPSR